MADERPIGYWLKLLDRLIEQRVGETLEEHGVTRTQWQLLTVLSRGPAAAVELDRAVAPYLEGAEPSTAAEHLTELIESGWVSATQSGYELTERGGIAYSSMAERVDELRTRSAAGIDESDYAVTVATLARMAENLAQHP